MYFILEIINAYVLLTYLLTPWSRVLLEKLATLQLVKKFPAFYGTRRYPHRTHKRPPPVPILSQPNPVLRPTAHLLEIYHNIILPSTPWSPQRSLPLGFPHQHSVHSSPFPHTGHNAYVLTLIVLMWRIG